jgi:Flp pilus assembly pilin Flp
MVEQHCSGHSRAAVNRPQGWLCRFWRDESGQDLLEYALLTATIGLASVAVWTAMGEAMGETYRSNIDAANAQWESPPPSAP